MKGKKERQREWEGWGEGEQGRERERQQHYWQNLTENYSRLRTLLKGKEYSTEASHQPETPLCYFVVFSATHLHFPP